MKTPDRQTEIELDLFLEQSTTGTKRLSTEHIQALELKLRILHSHKSRLLTFLEGNWREDLLEALDTLNHEITHFRLLLAEIRASSALN